MESLSRRRSLSSLRCNLEKARSLPDDLKQSLLETTNHFDYPALLDEESQRRSQSIFCSMGPRPTRLSIPVETLAVSVESPNYLINIGEEYIASPDSDNADSVFFADASSTHARGKLTAPAYTCACTHPLTIWCCCLATSISTLPYRTPVKTRTLDLLLTPRVSFRSSANETIESLLVTTAINPHVENIVNTLPFLYHNLAWSSVNAPPVKGWIPSVGNIQKISLKGKPGPGRRALIIGINYKGQTWTSDPVVEGKNGRTRVPRSYGSGDELKMDLFTHEDTKKIKELIKSHGYEENEIRMLLDDGGDPTLQPTKHNIEEGMRWLVKDACLGDRLFFYFAGHGEQVFDQDGDEDDGMDESILPVDHQGDVNQDIVDDEIFEAMVKPLPMGCKLTALIDCCHSGTLLDLRYPYRLNSFPLITDGLASGATGILKNRTRGRGRSGRKSTGCTYTADPTDLKITEHCLGTPFPQRHTFGDAVSISACMDSQVAYGNRRGGWMTNIFLQSLKSSPCQTHRELLRDTTARLNKRTARAIEVLKEEFLPQTVQLYSAHPLDLDAPFSF